jgi:hypothetical protein
MKKFYPVLLLLLLSPFITGCELAGDIFKFGLWAGIAIVVVIVGIIWYVIGKFRR